MLLQYSEDLGVIMLLEFSEDIMLLKISEDLVMLLQFSKNLSCFCSFHTAYHAVALI